MPHVVSPEKKTQRIIKKCKAKMNRASIGSDNGLSPLSEPMLAGVLLIGLLGANFSEILIKTQNFLFTKCI